MLAKKQAQQISARKLRLRALLLCLIAGALACLLHFLGWFQAAERLAYDLRVRLLSNQTAAHPDIVIIEINESSFARMQQSVGSWPWPRSLFAAVLQHCHQARSVTLDILFSEADQHFARGDEELAAEIKAHGRVINSLYLNQKGTRNPVPEKLFEVAALSDEQQLPPRLISAESALSPFADLLNTGAPLGHANSFPDSDGVVRRNPLMIQLQGRTIPSLALATAMAHLHLRPSDLQYVDQRLHYGSKSIPLDDQGLMRYIPPAEEKGVRYPRYNIADVLLSWNAVAREETPIIDPSVFKDKIVLVGSSAVGLYADRKITPVDPLMPGIVIHGALIENLLTQTTLRVFPPALLYGLCILLAFMPLFWRHPQRPAAVLISGLLTFVLYSAACLIALFAFHYMLPVAAPLNASLFALIGLAGLYWRQDWKKRRALEELETSKQNFTDMLVHDLKGQVSSIMLAADMINHRSNNKKEEDGPNKMGQIIHSSGARLLTQVNALLDIRRMDEGKMKVRGELIELNTILETIAKEYSTPAESVGASLHTDLCQANTMVRSDANLLRRILENLLWNAMHHGASGKPIYLRSRVMLDQVQIAVLNNGRAIPEEDQATLFQPYVTRTMGRQKNKVVGTGLGLTFCQMATEALGGSIEVYSPRRDTGDGAEFELTFNLESIAPISGK